MISGGAKAAKEGIKFAPVDPQVKNIVGGVADMVAAQADADVHTGIGDRAKIGVSE